MKIEIDITTEELVSLFALAKKTRLPKLPIKNKPTLSEDTPTKPTELINLTKKPRSRGLNFTNQPWSLEEEKWLLSVVGPINGSVVGMFNTKFGKTRTEKSLGAKLRRLKRLA
jgi:hypothetical protein